MKGRTLFLIVPFVLVILATITGVVTSVSTADTTGQTPTTSPTPTMFATGLATPVSASVTAGLYPATCSSTTVSVGGWVTSALSKAISVVVVNQDSVSVGRTSLRNVHGTRTFTIATTLGRVGQGEGVCIGYNGNLCTIYLPIRESLSCGAVSPTFTNTPTASPNPTLTPSPSPTIQLRPMGNRKS